MATTEPGAGTPTSSAPDWGERPLSGSDLARGMILLRASNMNVVRLQLATERRDRRLAMEALDGLVALDGEISGLIETMPSTDAALDDMARRLDAQKAVLASEKLVFAAGRTGPALARRDIAPAPRPASAATEEPARGLPPAATPGDTEPAWVPAYLLEEEETVSRGRRIVLVTAAALLSIVGAAAALPLFGVDGLAAFVAPIVEGAR